MSLDNVKISLRPDEFMLKKHRNMVEHGLFAKTARFGCREFNQKPAAAIGTACVREGYPTASLVTFTGWIGVGSE